MERPWRSGAAIVAHHALTVAVVGLALGEALVRHHGTARIAAVGWAAAFSLPVIARRRLPVPSYLAVLSVTMAASVTATNLEQDAVLMSLLVAAASAGRHEATRATWAVPAGVVIAMAAVIPTGTDLTDAIVVVALVSGAWFMGRSARLRTELREAVAERSELLRLESLRREQDALDVERARIARELHDVVGHAMSLITIRLQVVRRRLAADRPADAAEIAEAEQEARQALGEMRRLLDVLRTTGDGPERGPQPGLADLPALVARTRAAGLNVDLDIAPTPARLPAGLDLTAYRVVQEALTNTLRHAGATTATVRIGFNGDGLTLDVQDDGTVTAGAGEGHGLVGMRERVNLYGGRVTAGPLPRGGFRVSARIPMPTESP